MTENQIDMLKDDADKPKETVETLGQWLQAEREARQMTLASVAEQLNLRPSIVSDIEADNYDNIASVTYVKGYVKNYARILGLDKAKVDTYLAESFSVAAAPTMQSFSRKTTRQARDGRLMLVTYLIVFVLLALLVLWWVQKSALVADVDLSQPSVEEVAELSTASSDMPLTEDPQAMTGIEEDRQPITQEPLSDMAQASQVSTQSANPAALAASEPVPQRADAQTEPVQAEQVEQIMVEAELTLSLSGDCWIKITDAEGKVLVNGLKQAGKEMNLFGQEPFKVILGAPQSLTMRLNGEDIDLAKYPSGRVARLTVSSANL